MLIQRKPKCTAGRPNRLDRVQGATRPLGSVPPDRNGKPRRSHRRADARRSGFLRRRFGVSVGSGAFLAVRTGN